MNRIVRLHCKTNKEHHNILHNNYITSTVENQHRGFDYRYFRLWFEPSEDALSGWTAHHSNYFNRPIAATNTAGTLHGALTTYTRTQSYLQVLRQTHFPNGKFGDCNPVLYDTDQLTWEFISCAREWIWFSNPCSRNSNFPFSKRRRHFEITVRRCELCLKMTDQPSLKRDGTMAVTAQVKQLAYSVLEK